VAYDIPIGPINALSGLHTPTSLAMRYSLTFFGWRQVLIEKGQDLQQFVINELQTSPLASQGWTQETLLALFHYTFQPYPRDPHFRYYTCRGCLNVITYAREPPWERKVEMIRQGRILELQRLDKADRDEFASENEPVDRYSVNPDDGAAKSDDASNTKMVSSEQESGAWDSDGDESTASETSSSPRDWPWKILCDRCAMGLEATSSQEGPRGEENASREQADFKPNMPGSFDI
jgi:hypothetical protein